MKKDYFVGLDLGQSQDFTALVILERMEYAGAWDAAAFCHEAEVAVRLRYIERIPLGTTYPDIVARVAKVMRSPAVAQGKRYLMVDATGVGRRVGDLLERGRLPCQMIPVSITGGANETVTKGTYKVPKRDLVVTMVVMLQEGRL